MIERPRVLVVEDMDTVRRAIVRELATGFEVLEAATVDEALSVLDRADAVVTDLDLGGGSGLDVLRQARAMRDGRVRVLISGTADPAIIEPALREGLAHRFVAKPWPPGHILGILRVLLLQAPPRTDHKSA